MCKCCASALIKENVSLHHELAPRRPPILQTRDESPDISSALGCLSNLSLSSSNFSASMRQRLYNPAYCFDVD